MKILEMDYIFIIKIKFPNKSYNYEHGMVLRR